MFRKYSTTSYTCYRPSHIWYKDKLSAQEHIKSSYCTNCTSCCSNNASKGYKSYFQCAFALCNLMPFNCSIATFSSLSLAVIFSTASNSAAICLVIDILVAPVEKEMSSCCCCTALAAFTKDSVAFLTAAPAFYTIRTGHLTHHAHTSQRSHMLTCHTTHTLLKRQRLPSLSYSCT